MSEEIKYIVEPDEERCIALKIKSTIVYCYPICEAVLEHYPKVMTRLGKVVKKVQMAVRDSGKKVITGLLDEERLVWDEEGRYNGDEDSDLNLYVPERYWDRDWKSKIKLSNGAWCLKYQRSHPYAKMPENRQRYYKGEL